MAAFCNTFMTAARISRVAVVVMATLAGLSGCGPAPTSPESAVELQVQQAPAVLPNPESPLRMPMKETSAPAYFDKYILKAVAYLYDKHRFGGYDVNAVYTHDLLYGTHGVLKSTMGTKTMCVAAVLEVMIVAMQIYEKETGNKKIWDFLPLKSWKGLSVRDIRGHIWVNSKFDAAGTGDALARFGLGELTPFEKLRPGAFINFNRHKGNGHAVVFMSFIDKNGKEYSTHNPNVIGFKYFSAQGLKDPATAGFDYRYAIFSKKEDDCPDMPYKKDCGIIYSKSRKMFNAGRMWAPANWNAARRDQMATAASTLSLIPDTIFNAEYFDGAEDTGD